MGCVFDAVVAHSSIISLWVSGFTDSCCDELSYKLIITLLEQCWNPQAYYVGIAHWTIHWINTTMHFCISGGMYPYMGIENTELDVFSCSCRYARMWVVCVACLGPNLIQFIFSCQIPTCFSVTLNMFISVKSLILVSLSMLRGSCMELRCFARTVTLYAISSHIISVSHVTPDS